MPGILYIVPTPVGNLDDMTFRAVQVLKDADLILAEDTRTSGILLNHYGIHGKLQKISRSDSKVEVWVVPTNEELLIARDTLALISK